MTPVFAPCSWIRDELHLQKWQALFPPRCLTSRMWFNVSWTRSKTRRTLTLLLCRVLAFLLCSTLRLCEKSGVNLVRDGEKIWMFDYNIFIYILMHCTIYLPARGVTVHKHDYSYTYTSCLLPQFKFHSRTEMNVKRHSQFTSKWHITHISKYMCQMPQNILLSNADFLLFYFCSFVF